MVNTFELYWQMSLFGGYKMAPINYMQVWLVEFRLVLQKSIYFILLSKQFYFFNKIILDTLEIHQVLLIVFTLEIHQARTIPLLTHQILLRN